MKGGDSVPQASADIARYEDEADAITRDALLAVRRTFITPFDRSDIQALVSTLDDTIDQMLKTAKAAQLFEVRSFEPSMQEMSRIIVQAAAVTNEAVPMLRAIGQNAARLNVLTDRVIQLEGRADDVHNAGVKSAVSGFARRSNEVHRRLRNLRSP